MNLFDSGDRWLLAAVLPEMRSKLDLSESQAGWLPSVVLLALAISSPLIGYVVDRFNRPRLLCAGVCSVEPGQCFNRAGTHQRSVATGARAGRCGGGDLGGDRAVAHHGLISPYHPRPGLWPCTSWPFQWVRRWHSALVRRLAKVTNWQVAFLAAGAPGLLLAPLALVVPEATAGGMSEGVDMERVRLHERAGPSPEDYTDLMVNSSYTYSLFGITFSSFALAGVSYWSRAFLIVAKGLPDVLVDSTLGISFLGGTAILGTLAGGVLAEWSSRRNVRGALHRSRTGDVRGDRVRSGGGLLAVGAIGFRGINAGDRGDVPEHRALLHHHLDGDDAQHAWCGLRGGAGGRQFWLGAIWADTDGVGGGYLRAEGCNGHRVRPGLEAIGARPAARPGLDPQNLTAAMLVVVPALLIAGSVLLAGSRHLPREMAPLGAKLRATPSRLARNRKAQSRPKKACTGGP